MIVSPVVRKMNVWNQPFTPVLGVSSPSLPDDTHASMISFIASPKFITRGISQYKEYVYACADEYQLDSSLIFAVIKVESSFNERAVSSAGAKGLMQITDRTGAYIAEKLGITEYDLLDAKTSVTFGSFYLRYLVIIKCL